MGAPSLRPFEIAVHPNGDSVVLTLIGEFDMAAAQAFESCADTAIDSSAGVVIIDLAAVTFVDSTAIAALLNARRALIDQQRELHVRHADAPAVSRIFELAGLDELFFDPQASSA
jgi:anti-sigma B factor antagonist